MSDTTAMAGSSSTVTQHAKRRKTGLACKNCRAKKIKCDGVRPVCGACRKVGAEEDDCAWVHVDGRQEESPSLVATLQQRIKHLEALTQISPYDALDSVSDCHHNISALEGAATGQPQDEGFIGTASAATFMNYIRQNLEFTKSSSNYLPAAAEVDVRTTTTPRDQYVPELPPEPEIKRLLAVYRNFIHPIYPYIYIRDIETSIDVLKKNGSDLEGKSSILYSSPNVCTGTINACFALACQYTSGPHAANIYFNRARSVFHYDPCDDNKPSLSLVQMMLLMIQYQKGIGNTYRAWELLGLAIRISQRLGLHLAVTTRNQPLKDREMIARVWHTCLMFEKTFCMTLGRPSMVMHIMSEQTPEPVEVDEEYFQTTRLLTTIQASTRSEMTFFVLSARLYDIVQEIMVAFYSSSLGKRPFTHYDLFDAQLVFEIDAKLEGWFCQVPSHIQLDGSRAVLPLQDEITAIFQRQAVVLRVRYLQVRLYLFRPLLAISCVKGLEKSTTIKKAGENLSQRTAVQCSLICVQAAVELIQTVSEHLTTAESWGQKPFWLHGVLHIYLAATVLLAARMAPVAMLTETPETVVHNSWKAALGILRSFQVDQMSAQRCVAALELLYSKLPLQSRTENMQNNPLLSSANLTVSSQEFEASGIGSHSSQDQPINETLALDFDFDFDLSDPFDMSWFDTFPLAAEA